MKLWGDDTDVLKAPPVHVVFWGHSWNDSTGLTKDIISKDVASIVSNADYFSPADEYAGVIGHPKSVDFVVVSSNPAASEPPDQSTKDVGALFTDKTLPRMTSGDEFYILMLPAGSKADYGAAYHASLSAKIDSQFYDVAYSVIDTSNSTLADVSDSISHELIEGLTNPWNTGVYGRGTANGCDPAVDNPTCEVADVCDPGSDYGNLDPKTPDGFSVASYWLESKGKCFPQLNNRAFGARRWRSQDSTSVLGSALRF